MAEAKTLSSAILSRFADTFLVNRGLLADFNNVSRIGIYTTDIETLNFPPGYGSKYGILIQLSVGWTNIQIYISSYQNLQQGLLIRTSNNNVSTGWYKMSAMSVGGNTLFTNYLCNLAERRVA